MKKVVGLCIALGFLVNLTEAATMTLSAHQVISDGGWQNVQYTFVSDDQYATTTIANVTPPYTLMKLAIEDPQDTSGTINQVVIKVEQHIYNYYDDRYMVYSYFSGQPGGNSGPLPGSATDSIITYDITNQVDSWADIIALEVGVRSIKVGQIDGVWMVDYVFVTVEYTSQLDVGVTEILSPPDSVFTRYTYTPAAKVKNFTATPCSPTVTCRIDTANSLIYNSVKRISLSGYEEKVVDFDDWTTFRRAGITYRVEVFTQLVGDNNPSNDTLRKQSLAIGDVGVSSIDSPPESVYVNTLYQPSATVVNHTPGFTDAFPVFCYIDSSGTTVYADTVIHSGLGGFESGQVIFDWWLTGQTPGIVYWVTVFTDLEGDIQPQNDTCYKMVITIPNPEHDVAPISIEQPPDTVMPHTSYTPEATVVNYGTATETFDVTCQILLGEDEVYSGTRTVDNLPENSTKQVSFEDWTSGDPGTIYLLRIQTWLIGDENPANDTLSKQIVVHSTGCEEPSESVRSSVLEQWAPSPSAFPLRICFYAPAESKAVLRIYDSSGRLVRTLFDGVAGPGETAVLWDGCNDGGHRLPSGVYFSILTVGARSSTRKLLIMK